ncbi:MAG: hypothetical protein RLZZ60_1043 [Bacteroidota bacterium]|jgi:uncharacterized protein YlxP (DUF503 family)
MKDSLSHLHLVCEDWKRELLFMQDEIPILKSRLSEVVSKNTASDVLKEVEHFENKFNILRLHLDELLHDVNLKMNAIQSQAIAKPNYISVKMVESDAQLEDLMHTNALDFYDTKKTYYKFLSKVM